MKVILVGHQGSQHIVPVSKYLTSKYLPKDWEIIYLNYTGEINGWAAFVANHLKTINDERVIFALDDYLISNVIDSVKFAVSQAQMNGDPFCICVKLCCSSPEENTEYPVTTQYSLWDREYLIRLLGVVQTPWEFELKGSEIHKLTEGKSNSWYVFNMPCLKYNTSSALSARWNGVDLKGVSYDDFTEMSSQGLLNGLDIPWKMKREVTPAKSDDQASRRKAVVLGGSGFLGTALIQRLLTRSDLDVVAMARNEGALVALKEKFPQITIMVGDISDAWSVKSAMVDADEVYLLSAMKHVGLAEMETNACVLTNIIGTMNVVNESLTVKPTVLMFISSDKAASGNGVYGGSKKIGERLFAEAERMNAATKYRVIRYGNVWNSTGSISTKWKPKMQKGEEVIITDPEAYRFFWTVDEAVELIFECIEKATDAAPYIPKMKAVKMGVVLEAMMDVYGKSPVKTIGLQPGENKVETTDGVVFSDQCEQFGKEEFKAKFLTGPLVWSRERSDEPSIFTPAHPKISAVLITREKEYPQIILDRLTCDGFFNEIIIVPECPSVYDRYAAARTAKNDIIYVQDDDCMVNYHVLFNSYKGQIVNAITEPFQKKYEESGCTLVGWGCFFPKSAINALDRYIFKYGPNDKHLHREADRIFTFLNAFNTVLMPHEDLRQATAPDRMGYEPDHESSMAEALVKAKLLL